MNVEIIHRPALRVACVHHTRPYNQISQAFAGLFGRPGAAMLGIFRGDPESRPQEQLRSEAGVVVPDEAPLPEGLDEHRLPAGLPSVQSLLIEMCPGPPSLPRADPAAATVGHRESGS